MSLLRQNNKERLFGMFIKSWWTWTWHYSQGESHPASLRTAAPTPQCHRQRGVGPAGSGEFLAVTMLGHGLAQTSHPDCSIAWANLDKIKAYFRADYLTYTKHPSGLVPGLTDVICNFSWIKETKSVSPEPQHRC